MAVVQLVKFTNKDTVAVLRYLLDQALRGEVVGIAVCYRMRDGEEDSLFSGLYKARPNEGAGAAMRLSLELAQVKEGI
jgi:hypothetical protein